MRVFELYDVQVPRNYGLRDALNAARDGHIQQVTLEGVTQGYVLSPAQYEALTAPQPTSHQTMPLNYRVPDTQELTTGILRQLRMEYPGGLLAGQLYGRLGQHQYRIEKLLKVLVEEGTVRVTEEDGKPPFYYYAEQQKPPQSPSPVDDTTSLLRAILGQLEQQTACMQRADGADSTEYLQGRVAALRAQMARFGVPDPGEVAP